MKSANHVVSLTALIVWAAVPASRAADARIWLSGKDSDALEMAEKLLSSKGLGVTYAKGDIPSGVYVAIPSFNRTGQEMDSGYAVAGGATTLVVYFHCTRNVDLFVGRWTSGYYGYEKANLLDRDVWRMNSNAMSTEIDQWIGSDMRNTVENTCKKFVKRQA